LNSGSQWFRDVLRLAREPEEPLLERGIVDDDVADEVGIVRAGRLARRFQQTRPQRLGDWLTLEGSERATREDACRVSGRGTTLTYGDDGRRAFMR